jgi:hypothetical protein
MSRIGDVTLKDLTRCEKQIIVLFSTLLLI